MITTFVERYPVQNEEVVLFKAIPVLDFLKKMQTQKLLLKLKMEHELEPELELELELEPELELKMEPVPELELEP